MSFIVKPVEDFPNQTDNGFIFFADTHIEHSRQLFVLSKRFKFQIVAVFLRHDFLKIIDHNMKTELAVFLRGNAAIMCLFPDVF